MKRLSLLTAVALGLVGCGGGGEPQERTAAACAITDEKLCQLRCDVTTEEEALAILGEASSSVRGGTGSMFNYNCHLGAGSMYQTSFVFSAVTGYPTPLLTGVSRGAVGSANVGPLPSCLSDCR